MWVAADSGDLATALIPAVWTFLGIVVSTIALIYLQSRRDRRDSVAVPAAPVAVNGNGTTHLLTLATNQGVHTQRLDDHDDAIELADRVASNNTDRIEAIERHLDRRDPGWRTE